MISERTLALAIERGVLTLEQAGRLRGLETEAEREPRDDEKLRFITGFGDIFVAIGLTLFLGATGYFAALATGLFGFGVVLAVVSWLLAEFFVRRRRMALPSILLLVAFAFAVFCAVFSLTGGSWPSRLETPDTADLSAVRGAVVAALATAALVGVHYRRFRVPITVAAGVAALVLATFAALTLVAPGLVVAWFRPILFGSGIVVFTLAMRFDLSDPMRVTRRTDIAFWLHFLAAPLIVHPLIGGFVWGGEIFDQAKAVEVLLIFLALGIIAVLVDRRAVLVSGLAYAGAACGSLLSRSHLGGNTAPATVLVLGAFVLLLSAGWRPLRATFLSWLPAPLARRLPNTGIASSQ